jgi:CheY-like chemotaxis protein
MGARLTERLLTFSRKRRLEPMNINLYEQVVGMAELLRRTLGETIDLDINLTPHLWPVRIDAGGIENAILNLALNARDAMSRGGKLIIEARNMTLDEENPASLLPGDYVLLSVSDSGTGMPAEVLQHAFEPFFTTKGPDEGTGLGLASVYGFVKQSGGYTGIHSEVGRGTTVDVYLPRLVDGEVPVAESTERTAIPMVAGETILAVEDNPLVRRSTVRRLEALGFKVIEAESGLAAVKLLEDGSAVDLVFSDVVMPGGMSGLDLAQWIRETRPALKIVLTSGYTEEIAGGHELPEVTILRKPYDQTELLRTLRECLNA